MHGKAGSQLKYTALTEATPTTYIHTQHTGGNRKHTTSFIKLKATYMNLNPMSSLLLLQNYTKD
jgi:hypothetical protein